MVEAITLPLDVYLRDNCTGGAIDFLWDGYPQEFDEVLKLMSRCPTTRPSLSCTYSTKATNTRYPVGSPVKSSLLSKNRNRVSAAEVIRKACAQQGASSTIRGAHGRKLTQDRRGDHLCPKPSERSVQCNGVGFSPDSSFDANLDPASSGSRNSVLLRILPRYLHLSSMELSITKFVEESCRNNGTLPSLKLLKLWLNSQQIHPFASLLQRLNMPLLRKLHIKVSAGHGNLSVLPVMKLEQHIMSRLKKLTLHRFSLEKFAVGLFVNLETLELTDCSHTGEFIFALIREPDTHSCLLLQHLDLRYSNQSNIVEDMHALAGLINVRSLVSSTIPGLQPEFSPLPLLLVRVEVPLYTAEFFPVDEMKKMGVIVIVRDKYFPQRYETHMNLFS